MSEKVTGGAEVDIESQSQSQVLVVSVRNTEITVFPTL